MTKDKIQENGANIEYKRSKITKLEYLRDFCHLTMNEQTCCAFLSC